MFCFNMQHGMLMFAFCSVTFCTNDASVALVKVQNCKYKTGGNNQCKKSKIRQESKIRHL